MRLSSPGYTEFHPRWYRTRVSTYWWLLRLNYVRFILRELSSIFVASFVVITLMQVRALALGPGPYAEFQEWLRTPIVVIWNVISFLFVVYHTVTWFNLTPRAMTVRLGGKRLPDLLIAGSNYVVWLVVSGIVAWLILGK
jgi:fumarate reductase subunit C